LIVRLVLPTPPLPLVTEILVARGDRAAGTFSDT
jgi:hypothetical protein